MTTVVLQFRQLESQLENGKCNVRGTMMSKIEECVSGMGMKTKWLASERNRTKVQMEVEIPANRREAREGWQSMYHSGLPGLYALSHIWAMCCQ